MLKPITRIANNICDDLTTTIDEYRDHTERGRLRAAAIALSNATRRLVEGTVAATVEIFETVTDALPVQKSAEEPISARKERIALDLSDTPGTETVTPQHMATTAAPSQPGMLGPTSGYRRPVGEIAAEAEAGPRRGPIKLGGQHDTSEQTPIPLGAQPRAEATGGNGAPATDELPDSAFSLSAADLAATVGLTQPKSRALIWYLGIEDDPALYRELGPSPSKVTKHYTPAAADRIKSALADVDIDAIWADYKAADYGKAGPPPKAS